MTAETRGASARAGREGPNGRFISEVGCRDLFARLQRMCRGGGSLQLMVQSRQDGYVRWARNEIIASGDTLTHDLFIARRQHGVWGVAMVDRLDDEALEDTVRRAEQEMRAQEPSLKADAMIGLQAYRRPTLWSDGTFAIDAMARAKAQGQLVAPVQAADLLSSGFIRVSAIGHGIVNSQGLFAYLPETRAECSVTVRDPKGTASGWAGKSHRDWSALDATQLVARALDKCQRSKNAVAIEPGRYTVVLEPQATADFVGLMLRTLVQREQIEANHVRPWWARQEPPARVEGYDNLDSLGFRNAGTFTHIGEKVLDPRVTISADPADPEMPFVPFATDGSRTQPTTWIENGILRQIGYGQRYARAYLHQAESLNNGFAFRMAGGPTSTADMIAGIERGLLVTRFVNARFLDPALGGESLLETGNTSDGLWLIEKGKIKEPVQNFRFRESPIFALNNLEAVGPAERVFYELPAIVPSLKIRDFSMTSLANAV